jgi:lactate permease
LIAIKLSVIKSGIISLVLALVIALAFFGMPVLGLSVAVGKALWLALFVSLIVWGALFLYHLSSDFKALDVITQNITIFVKDKIVSFILLAWLFTGLLQGMAGFGVPPVIVAPVLIALGFNPARSLAAALLGHSWAVNFGSMGAAFYVISYLTGIPPEDLGFPMLIFNTIAHLLTGFGVCFFYDGYSGIKKGLPYILAVSAVMAAVQYVTIFFEIYSLATIVPALAGIATLYILYRLRLKNKEKSETYSESLTLSQSLLPYMTIIVMAVVFAFVLPLLPFESQDVALSFNFPGFETSLGHVVTAVESGYMPIKVFQHPAILLLLACAVAVVVFKRAGVWDSAAFRDAAKKTVKKGIPATISLVALGVMSLIMMYSGMTHRLAYDVADLTGRAYPVFSPFFGVLASFLTGNNTNSNVLFGAFQYAIAERLGVSTEVMTAVQSISGSVGVSLAPTFVMMGTIATNQKGQESAILKKLIPVVLLIALFMGIVNFILLDIIKY